MYIIYQHYQVRLCQIHIILHLKMDRGTSEAFLLCDSLRRHPLPLSHLCFCKSFNIYLVRWIGRNIAEQIGQMLLAWTTGLTSSSNKKPLQELGNAICVSLFNHMLARTAQTKGQKATCNQQLAQRNLTSSKAMGCGYLMPRVW